MSHFRVNVLDQQQAQVVVPNTGSLDLNNGQGHDGFIVFGVIACAMVLVAIGLFGFSVMKRRKRQYTLLRSCGLGITPHKRIGFGIFALIMLVASASFLVSGSINKSEEVQAESHNQKERFLSISADDVDLTVELPTGGDNAFGYASSAVTVNDGTQSGYKLGVYADGVELKSESGDVINNLAEGEKSELKDNTWGIALENPDQGSKIWKGLPNSSEEPLLIKETNTATLAKDTTTIYFGVKINKDLHQGVYTGPTINYVAVANVVEPDFEIEFGGDGVYFDEAKTQTKNVVGFAQDCSAEQAYVGDQYVVSKTENVDENGNWNGEATFFNEDRVEIAGAEKLLVEVSYNVGEDNLEFEMQGGSREHGRTSYYYVNRDSQAGTAKYLIDGDSVVFGAYTIGKTRGLTLSGGGEESQGLKYGYLAKVYPVFGSAQPHSTIQTLPEQCKWRRVSGEYKEPILNEGKDFAGWNAGYVDFLKTELMMDSEMLKHAAESMGLDMNGVMEYLLNSGVPSLRAGERIVFKAETSSYFTIEYNLDGAVAKICPTLSMGKDSGSGSLKASSGEGVPILGAKPIGCTDDETEDTTVLTQKVNLDDGKIHRVGEFDQYVKRIVSEDNNKADGWARSAGQTEPEFEDGDEIDETLFQAGEVLRLHVVWGKDSTEVSM